LYLFADILLKETGEPYRGRQRYHSAVCWKRVAIALQWSILLYAVFPILFPLASVVTTLDPFSHTILVYLRNNDICDGGRSCIYFLSALYTTTKVILTFAVTTEGCRSSSIILSMLVYWLEMQMKCLRQIGSLCLSNRIEDQYLFLRMYSELQISYKTCKQGIGILMGILMSGGFVVFVTCNVLVIKGYHIVPLSVYVGLALTSVLCGFFIYLLLPVGIEVFRNTDELLRQRKNWFERSQSVDTKARACIKKMYAAMQPQTVNCSSFLTLRKESDSGYFFQIFLKTVDGTFLPYFE